VQRHDVASRRDRDPTAREPHKGARLAHPDEAATRTTTEVEQEHGVRTAIGDECSACIEREDVERLLKAHPWLRLRGGCHVAAGTREDGEGDGRCSE
jgi:hypothetical protein